MEPGRGPRAAKQALAAVGIEVDGRVIGRGALTHVLTHRKLSVHVFSAASAKGGRPSPSARAVAPSALGEIGVSSLTRRILELAPHAADADES